MRNWIVNRESALAPMRKDKWFSLLNDPKDDNAKTGNRYKKSDGRSDNTVQSPSVCADTNVKNRAYSRRKERERKKEKEKQLREDQRAVMKINSLLKCIFNEDELNELARKSKFIERERNIKPLAFLSVLLSGCVANTDSGVKALARMCDCLESVHDTDMAISSLWKKINSPGAAQFMKEIMQKVLAHELEKAFNKVSKQTGINFGLFSRILIQDSTVISLPDTVSRIFRGCGGSASKAAVKIDFIINQINHSIIRAKCFAGRIPDVTLSSDIISFLNEGDLVIRDLGYFKLSDLSKISLKKAYFISRLSKSVNVYLNKDDKTPVDLIEHLKEIGIDNQSIDINVYLGVKEKIFVRLVGIKVPPEVIEARRQQYRKARGKSEPCESLMIWNGYTLMVTNISKENLSVLMILKMYKIRWQIELFFKNVKSNLKIDKITGRNKYRVLCFLYIKIVISWIASLIFALAQEMIGYDKELSFIKFTKTMREECVLISVFVRGEINDFLDRTEKSWKLMCKSNPKTTKAEIEHAYAKEENKKNAKEKKKMKKNDQVNVPAA